MQSQEEDFDFRVCFENSGLRCCVVRIFMVPKCQCVLWFVVLAHVCCFDLSVELRCSWKHGYLINWRNVHQVSVERLLEMRGLLLKTGIFYTKERTIMDLEIKVLKNQCLIHWNNRNSLRILVIDWNCHRSGKGLRTYTAVELKKCTK